MTEYKVKDDGVVVTVNVEFIGVPGKSIEEKLGKDTFDKMCTHRCAQIVDSVMFAHKYGSTEEKLKAVLEIFD